MYPSRPALAGCIMLDVEGENFPEIAQEITSNLVLSGKLPPEHTDAVLKVLLKKHKHTHDVTLWEKMKQSALDPGMFSLSLSLSLPPSIYNIVVDYQTFNSTEGRLHYLGEGLRRISHAHRLADLGSGVNMSMKRSSSGEDLITNKSHSGSEIGSDPISSVHRNASAPQMAVKVGGVEVGGVEVGGVEEC